MRHHTLARIFAACRADYDKRDCLIHGDVHVFNVLVEPKMNPNDVDDSFGATGDVCLVDWEMCMEEGFVGGGGVGVALKGL